MSDRKEAKSDKSLVPTQASRSKNVKPYGMYQWPPLAGLNVDVRVQDDGDIHFELQDVTGTKGGIFLQKCPLVITGVRFEKLFSAGLLKGRSSNASKPVNSDCECIRL